MQGTRIGPYEVLEPIGAGGMGEVYLAQDTRLARKVALKALPEAFAADPERLARFEREARTLASLNHANIAQVHGLERGERVVIVMELVEGEDLAERLERGPLPLEEALPVARQIAEALAAAHEAGVVHRDLKPANVKLRPDGTVKVLDFGLAKADPVASPSVAGATRSPTLLSPALSEAGVILGTAAYMSPEQAKGRAVDRRADVWAFGCVLLELLTGQRAFGGDDVTEVLAAVIKDAPPLEALPHDTPASIRRLLRRCLQKDPRVRLDSMRAACLEIDDAGAVEGPPQARDDGRRWRLAALTLAGILAVAVVIVPLLAGRGDVAPAATPVRLQIAWPEEGGDRGVSPDGRLLTLITREGLQVRRLEESEWRTVVKGNFDSRLIWAPDSRRFAFRDGEALRIADLVGSPPRTVCSSCVGGWVRGLAWNGEGTILAGNASDAGILAVDVDSGEVRSLLEPDRERGYNSLRLPSFLPDGRRFLFTARSDSGDHSILLGSLDDAAPLPLVAAYSTSAFAAGHLLFVRDGTLYAQAMNADAGTVSGDPRVLVPAIWYLGAVGLAEFEVAGGRALLYDLPSQGAPVTWVGRDGRPLETVDLPWGATNTQLFQVRSFDGSRLAVVATDETLGSTDIYVYDVQTGAQTRVTDDPRWDQAPAWTADGGAIVYLSARADRPGAYLQPLDGGPERFLAEVRSSFIEVAPVGQTVLVQTDEGIQRFDLTSPDEIETWEPRGAGPAFSPDARHVAFVSDASGSSQVYVRPLEGPGRHRIATACEAGFPRWSRDGTEVFFACGGQMHAVAALDADALRFGEPGVLFSLAGTLFGSNTGFEVDAQGRFLLRLLQGEEGRNVTGLILDWPGLLQQ